VCEEQYSLDFLNDPTELHKRKFMHRTADRNYAVVFFDYELSNELRCE